MSINQPRTEDTREAAQRYLRAGFAVIPVPPGEKNPNRRGWQTERWTVGDVPQVWTNGGNIGVLTGEPSGWLVDVDLDVPEAAFLAGRFLSPTRTSGRESAPDSHWWYVSEGLPSVTFEDLGDGEEPETLVEIRSTGRQTVIAPSLHPSGERYRWNATSGLEVARVGADDLLCACRGLATAVLVARVLPKGGRHRFGLALAGFLLRRGLDPETVEKIMHAAWDAAGFDSEKAKREAHRDIAGIVSDTAEKLAEGQEIVGDPTLDGLRAGLARKIRRYWRWEGRRDTADAKNTAPGGFNRTDLGNAERLVARHGDNLRYCHPLRKWFRWDGKRWALDTSGEVARLAAETVRSIYDEAKRETDPDVRKALARHAVTSEARARIEAMIALAQSRPGTPVKPEDLDTDPWLLNCLNGTLDLRTGELREHSRDDLLTKLVSVAYNEEAEAPRFLRFLREVFGGDEDLISFVRRFSGYSLTGSTEERLLAILYGRGKNGKTTLVELLADTMGDYARNTDVETVLQKSHRGGGASPDVAALVGARFVSASEIEQGRHLAEGKIKNLTGSDTVTARFLFAEFFDFKPQFKLWLSTNNKPVIKGTDDAIWDRIRLIPFGERFDGERRDAKLPEKLREEREGVLAWLVRGCMEWRRSGLGEPKKVTEATEDYRAEMDVLADFIEDRCEIGERPWVKFADLWNAYTEWCKDANEEPETKRRFADLLTERGLEKDHGTGNVAIRRGIGLREGTS